MNMSYCRFQNTLNDLRDCYQNWDEYADEEHSGDDRFEVLSKDEREARESLMELCRKIVNEFDDEHIVATLDEYDEEG